MQCSTAGSNVSNDLSLGAVQSQDFICSTYHYLIVNHLKQAHGIFFS